MLERRGLNITFFVVGKDADLPANESAIGSIVDAGHEVANHSYMHEPWLHEYSQAQLEDEFDRAEAALAKYTGQRPLGFRGPGFSLSPAVIELLARRKYAYDASTFPTFIGPLARAYFFARAPLGQRDKESRKKLYGSLRDGFRSLRAYPWTNVEVPLLEIPVTTFPLIRAPIHLTYLVYLSRWSTTLAVNYLNIALQSCRLAGIAPSFLLHPTDFLGNDDESELHFFPGMDLTSKHKLALVERVFDCFQTRFECVNMRQHAEHVFGCPLAVELRGAESLDEALV
jgi:peptidoglycan/xylan/chitin deacetylase (PgdA/CDA1 family)